MCSKSGSVGVYLTLGGSHGPLSYMFHCSESALASVQGLQQSKVDMS